MCHEPCCASVHSNSLPFTVMQHNILIRDFWILRSFGALANGKLRILIVLFTVVVRLLHLFYVKITLALQYLVSGPCKLSSNKLLQTYHVIVSLFHARSKLINTFHIVNTRRLQDTINIYGRDFRSFAVPSNRKHKQFTRRGFYKKGKKLCLGFVVN